MANVDIDEYDTRVALKQPDPDDLQWAKSQEQRIGWRLGHVRLLSTYLRAAWVAGEYEYLKIVRDIGMVAFDHGIFRSVSGVQYVKDPLRIGKFGILGALVGVHGTEKSFSGDSAVMTELEVACRTYIFETAQFLIRRVPGFEKAYLHIIAPYFHSRGGRSIVSESPVSQGDVDEGRRREDVVFISDSHPIPRGPDGSVTADQVYGYTRRQTYDFPYRQFLPRGVEGLLVTGRAAIIQPPTMRVRWMVFLMAQAAGAAAAIAAKAGVAPRDLNVRELQRLLHHEYDVPLGDEERLRELGII